jgi:hypothetical protein
MTSLESPIDALYLIHIPWRTAAVVRRGRTLQRELPGWGRSYDRATKMSAESPPEALTRRARYGVHGQASQHTSRFHL